MKRTVRLIISRNHLSRVILVFAGISLGSAANVCAQTTKPAAEATDDRVETRGIQIAVDVRMLRIDPVKGSAALCAKLKNVMEGAGVGKIDEQLGAAFLSDEQTEAILTEARGVGGHEIVTAPRITAIDGQSANLRIGSTRPYVAGYTILRAENGETRCEPKNEQAFSGLTLDVTATSSNDRKHVTLSLRPTLTNLDGMASAPFDHAPPGMKDLTIDVPMMSVSEMRTILSIPSAQTAVIGGLTQFPTGEPVFLLVRPEVIVQRYNEPATRP